MSSVRISSNSVQQQSSSTRMTSTVAARTRLTSSSASDRKNSTAVPTAVAVSRRPAAATMENERIPLQAVRRKMTDSNGTAVAPPLRRRSSNSSSSSSSSSSTYPKKEVEEAKSPAVTNAAASYLATIRTIGASGTQRKNAVDRGSLSASLDESRPVSSLSSTSNSSSSSSSSTSRPPLTPLVVSTLIPTFSSTVAMSSSSSSSSSTTSATSSWSCSACTYSNPLGVNRCEICLSMKSSVGRTQIPIVNTHEQHRSTYSSAAPTTQPQTPIESAASSTRAAAFGRRRTPNSSVEQQRETIHATRAMKEAAAVREQAKSMMVQQRSNASVASSASPYSAQQYFNERNLPVHLRNSSSQSSLSSYDSDERDVDSDDDFTHSRPPPPHSSSSTIHPPSRNMFDITSHNTRVARLQSKIDAEIEQIEKQREERARRRVGMQMGMDEDEERKEDIIDNRGYITSEDDMPSREIDSDGEEDGGDDQWLELDVPAPQSHYLSQTRHRIPIMSAASSSSHVISSHAPIPTDITFGSLSVRMDRRQALRREMMFLSNMFDQVNRVGTNTQQGSAHELEAASAGGAGRLLMWSQLLALQQSSMSNQASPSLLDLIRAELQQLAQQPYSTEVSLPDGHAERVAALESHVVSSSSSSTTAPDDCCICLDSMQIGTRVSSLANCKHLFHSTCIKQWLGKANVCPLCKREAIQAPA